MRIKKDAQIPLDAEFTVSQSGVIGDYYVDIRGGRLTAVIREGCVPEKGIGPSGSDDGKSEEADGFRSADEREYREDGRKVGS